MQRNRKQKNFRYGRLPESAPLANPYVPFQQDDPPKYEARAGLVRGTLFPGLELPFLGMANQTEKKNTPLSELQALNFAIQELALYLDTHRNDQEALSLYRSYQELYSKCVSAYSKAHGPMTHLTPSESASYNWLDDPWPWEYCANMEV